MVVCVCVGWGGGEFDLGIFRNVFIQNETYNFVPECCELDATCMHYWLQTFIMEAQNYSFDRIIFFSETLFSKK